MKIQIEIKAGSNPTIAVDDIIISVDREKGGELAYDIQKDIRLTIGRCVIDRLSESAQAIADVYDRVVDAGIPECKASWCPLTDDLFTDIFGRI